MSLFDFLPRELEESFASWGIPPYRARQVIDWLYRKEASSWEAMANIGAATREQLQSKLAISSIQFEEVVDASDGETSKFLWQLKDGLRVESVLIRAPGRRTVCVSTQVGCPARCAFCASGRQGLLRDLTAAEIVEQVWQIQRWLGEREERVTHVVYMGMGEPLRNYDNVVRSIQMLQHPQLIGLGARRITVSTVGVLENMVRLAREDLGVSLVLSLHAPNQNLRRKIIPYARHYELSDLMEAMEEFAEISGRDPTYEYTLLAGLNDLEQHAVELAALMRGRRGVVNLIPYNPVEGLRLNRPTPQAIHAFRNILDDHGILNTCRYTKGDDIAAACGQLALRPGLPQAPSGCSTSGSTTGCGKTAEPVLVGG
ncbi:MAG: 23S rRNA (adenine(2503)-C(2))-methyltransferase RlmN [Chlamydiia bacterium]